MSWPWFRMYSEARMDPKLDALTDREFRVWVKLLCLAAEDEPRGQVDILDLEFVAMSLRVGADELDSAISRMVRLRLVERTDTVVVFPAFGRRQWVKPSDAPDATRQRQRRSRAGRDKGVTSRDVTPTEQNRRRNRGGAGESAPPADPAHVAAIVDALRADLGGQR